MQTPFDDASHASPVRSGAQVKPIKTHKSWVNSAKNKD